MNTQTQTAVEMRRIEKSFGTNPVLKQVDFSVNVGEVHALAGENGAGKSTLMKILQGVYQKDAGEILVAGQAVEITDTFAARKAGIGMVFQEFSLIPTLTVAQNVFLTHEPTKFGLISDATAREQTAKLFADMGVEVDPTQSVENLPTALWQLTEIAKALAQNAKVLIMDEPTASLAKHEAEALFALIERLKARGIAIIYISHRMDEVYRIADRITVLRDGSRVLTEPLTAVTPAQIVEAIVGRQAAAHLVHQDRSANIGSDVVLAVEDLRSGSKLQGVSFAVKRGEILGLAGLMGSGRTELVNTIFGVDKVTSGSVKINGKAVNIRSPREAIQNGIALIPEDRRAQGLVLDHPVTENLTLPLLDSLKSGGLLSARRILQRSQEIIQQFAIKAAHPSIRVGALSGGNQQKVVIGKWLGTDPEILMMDEPTAGVDIGTKSEILDLVRQIADSGKSVILISSELPELLSVSDRILVLRDGQVAQELNRNQIPNEEFLQLAIQGAA
ncbi:MAG: sugar ABC transporter ATP-binding protein [Micrococcales bacterium]